MWCANISRTVIVALVWIAIVTYPTLAPGQCADTKLLASDAAANARFGAAVSLGGDRALIGSPTDNGPVYASGTAYVLRYDGTGWMEQERLTASDGAVGDCFGESVSLSGDLALIGASGHDGGKGAAYVFRLEGVNWVEKAKLVASDAEAGDQFGRSVSLSGDLALIGAYENDDDGSKSGSAYVFRFDGANWVEEAKLTASDAAAGDQFGRSVAVTGAMAVVGAPGDDDAGSLSGAAYVFRFDGANWVEEEKLTAPEGADWDVFGWSVATNGATIVIGSHGDDRGSGSAHVFQRNGSIWEHEAKLMPADAAPDGQFGWSVSVGLNRVVVGAHALGGPGSAYSFSDGDGKGWAEDAKLTAPEEVDHDEFGASVSVCGDVALVGAAGDRDAAEQAGAVHVFRCLGSPWGQIAELRTLNVPNNANFGDSVSLSGNRAVVGAPNDDEAGLSTGSAYVYRYDGSRWVQEERLIPGDASMFSYFGCSVAISGNTVVIGARGADAGGERLGAAYVFRHDGASWVEAAKLTPENPTGSRFGSSVALGENVAVIGDDTDPELGTSAGSAYVFRYDGSSWEEETKLYAAETKWFHRFGCSVAVNGDTVVIGAYGADDAGESSGSAYVFRYNGSAWVEEEELTADDAAEGARFGCAVSISENAVVVGADNYSNLSTDAGAAYVFRDRVSGWSQEAKLNASDGEMYDKFGASVAVSGTAAVIGAWYAGVGTTRTGAAYVFRFDGDEWKEEDKLTAHDRAEGDRFGASVSVSGNSAVVGAPLDDHAAGDDAGSAYIFTLQDRHVRTGEFWIQIADSQSAWGMEARVPVLLDFHHGEETSRPGVTVEGWSYTICNDPAVLVPIDVRMGDDTAALAARGAFWVSNITESSVSVVCVADMVPPFEGLDPQNEWRDAVVVYGVTPVPPDPETTETQLAVCEGFGNPPVENVLSVSQGQEMPLNGSSGGRLQFSTQSPFLRGDCNGNGVLNIADGVCLLYYLFHGGLCSRRECTCLDALDADDDGRVVLTDGVALLSYVAGVGSHLPEPLSGCGVDPTPDPLECEAHSPCE